jgi:ligand-binding sensor domain-containing protein
VIALGVALACCPCILALDPSLDINQYAHTSWKASEGFAKGQIHSIAETPDGYLWLGTDFGLLRFDGVRNVQWQTQAWLNTADVPGTGACQESTSAPNRSERNCRSGVNSEPARR